MCQVLCKKEPARFRAKNELVFHENEIHSCFQLLKSGVNWEGLHFKHYAFLEYTVQFIAHIIGTMFFNC